MKSAKTLKDLFSFPGFVSNARLKGVFGDPDVRIVSLRRRKKRPSAPVVATPVRGDMTKPSNGSVTCRWPVTGSLWNLSDGGPTVRGARVCM